jgi:phosphatidylinositol alpha-1,6-mannosyltransferase
MPLRVLFVSHSFPKPGSDLQNMGGMQRVAMQLWQELQNHPEIVCDGLILKANWDEIGRKTAGFLAKLLFELPKRVRTFKPDIVLFSSMVTASLAVPLRKKITVPMVSINHGQDVTLPNFFYQLWIRRVFKKLDATISVSAATREQTVNRGMPPKKAFIIHNGYYPIAQPITDRVAEKQTLYRKLCLDWPVDEPLLLTVGRQVKRKGHLWFLNEVLPLIQTKCRVILIGEGPESPVIKQKAAGIENVWWAGRQPDDLLKTAYRAADLFLMPNIPVPGDMEGFGIVLVEANAAGVPVIATRLEGMIDVIEDGQNGLLVEPLNAAGFAFSIDALLKEDRELLAGRAAAYAASHFSWKNIIQQYFKVLTLVANQHRGTRTDDGL